MENKEVVTGQSNGITVVNNVSVPPSKNGEDKSANSKSYKFVGVFKDVFGFLTEASYKSIVKFWVATLLFIILLVTGNFCYNAVNSDEFMSALAQKMEKNRLDDEESKLLIRTHKVTPKIQNMLKMLCYSLNADRAFMFELHNGKKNASGLPFRYADMSYEEVNEEKNIESCAMQFQDIPLTLYRYPHYLAEHRYIYGNLNEISEVDNGFAKHIERIGGKYLGMIYLTSGGLPLGFLCVSFHEEPINSEEVIKGKLEQYAKMITPLLDLTVQLKED